MPVAGQIGPLALLSTGVLAGSLFALTMLPGMNIDAGRFDDVTTQSKINFVNHSSHTSRKYLPETMVGGVAMIDYNNDGLLDLFFVNGAALQDPMPRGALPDKSGSEILEPALPQ